MTSNKTAKIQFYEGTDEPVVPEIRLTRSKDGTTGQALFLFENLRHYLQSQTVKLQVCV